MYPPEKVQLAVLIANRFLTHVISSSAQEVHAAPQEMWDRTLLLGI